MGTEQISRGAKLFESTLQSFCQGLVNAMRVAEEDDGGEPSKITQHALADRSGVARSTIAKYLAFNAHGTGDINPDLETICRLADALNVPPALLLMRPDDWRRLAQAAGTMAQAMADTKILEISNQVIQDKRSTAVTHAKSGLKIGERLGVCPALPPGECASGLDSDTTRVKRQIRQGALATSALPPVNLFRTNYCSPLLSLCASLGATTSVD